MGLAPRDWGGGGGGGGVGLNLASKPGPAYGKEKGSGHIRPGQNVDLTNQKR